MGNRRRSNRRIPSIRSGIRQSRRPGRSTRELSENSKHTQSAEQARQALSTAQGAADTSLVPYNPRLLSRARTRLQLGDWEQLAELDAYELEHNPASAELQLLAAAGHLQRGGAQSKERARALLDSAIEAGMDRESVARILIGGASNSLGRIAALSERSDDKVMHHFRSAIAIAVPDEDTDLLLQPTATRQLVQLARASGSEALMAMAQRTALNVPEDEPESSEDTGRDASKPEIDKQTEHDLSSRARYLNQNGEMLYNDGKYKLALEYFYRALQLCPENAWYCQNFAEAAARVNLHPEDQWECEELSQMVRRYGKWEMAVRHYRKAIRLDSAKVEMHRKGQTFDIDRSRYAQISKPIFIIGCGHSGTSLMQAILGSHPNIYPIPMESALFLESDATVAENLRCWDEECLSERKGRWIEKTPPHIFQIHRFLSFRPKAKFILMIRDGRDVVCSLRIRKGYGEIDERIERWVYDNLAAESYWNHPQVKCVKYEDVVTATTVTVRDVCEFIEEEYTSEMLDYHKKELYWYSDEIKKPSSIDSHKDHNLNRNWQINQPIFDGRDRWRAEMTEDEKRAFKSSRANDLLIEFGYESSPNW